MGLSKENTILLQKVGSLQNEVDNLKEIREENKRLKNLLDFADSTKAEYVAASVVTTGPSNFYHTLIINRGSEKGIERGMAVLTSRGVVGQISYTKEHYSSVITLLDPNSAIDAIIQESRARGILKGSKFQKLVFKYLPFSENVRVGDSVVSSGMDRIYPKGISVGVVESVENKKESLFQNVTVKPSVDFSKLEEVLVLIKKPVETQDEK